MAAVITSITGLQNLTGLTRFNADWNALRSVNLSNLPNLEDVDISDNDIAGTNTASLTSVNLSGSTAVQFLRLDDSDFSAGIPSLSGLTSLIVLDFDQCGISGILDFSGFPAITDIDVFGNPDLTSVIISSAQPITYVSAANCGLTETAVDDILVALDDNGEASGSAYLDGGTNAIPSATGLAAKTNLEGKGWVVSVNS
jgi:Leucine-rich repeat (LRR) protein